MRIDSGRIVTLSHLSFLLLSFFIPFSFSLPLPHFSYSFFTLSHPHGSRNKHRSLLPFSVHSFLLHGSFAPSSHSVENTSYSSNTKRFFFSSYCSSFCSFFYSYSTFSSSSLNLNILLLLPIIISICPWLFRSQVK